MNFQELAVYAKKYFPKLSVGYKTQSIFMKILAILLFFNKEFMTEYVSTVGNTVYFPTEDSTKNRLISNTIVFIHELVHMTDKKKLTDFGFSFLYLFPQVLVLCFFPMLFVSWKIALIFLVFALPLPAYFRMYFERRAYLASLYVMNFLYKKYGFSPALEKHVDSFLLQFTSSEYYYMWIFPNLKKDFSDAMQNIQQDKRPFEDPVFDMIDDLLKQI